MEFKAFVVISFESDCILNARMKLKVIMDKIKMTTPELKSIYINTREDKTETLFDKKDIK